MILISVQISQFGEETIKFTIFPRLLGYTPLHEACNRGNEAIVRLLLRNGADVNVLGGVGEQRESPLHDAARNGHIAVSILLLV